jgi:hypothetical protein
MPIYTVKKIYHYTETVEVEASSEREAKDKATGMEGDRNHDDHLYDCEVVGQRESE